MIFFIVYIYMLLYVRFITREFNTWFELNWVKLKEKLPNSWVEMNRIKKSFQRSVNSVSFSLNQKSWTDIFVWKHFYDFVFVIISTCFYEFICKNICLLYRGWRAENYSISFTKSENSSIENRYSASEGSFHSFTCLS